MECRKTLRREKLQAAIKKAKTVEDLREILEFLIDVAHLS